MRNWDYRYCWLRDTTLTLIAMIRAGYQDEAVAWRQWLLRAIAGDPADVQIMYGLAGERRLEERILEWLPGYEASLPVRVGNAASEQLQLDVYGEVIDALYQTRVHGAPADDNIWALTRKLLEWLDEGWRREDAGIWEVRGPEPALHAFEGDGLGCLRSRCSRPRGVRAGRPRRSVAGAAGGDQGGGSRGGMEPDLGAYVQYYGANELDASVLLMAMVGFLDSNDARFAATVDAIRRELTVDGLVQRYVSRSDGHVDGLPAGEGVFLPCSFWLAEVLALQGKHDEARELFERLLDLRNDVGLLAEEYDPVAGRQLGNFPQAFTHLALVSAAIAIGEGQSMRRPEGRTI